MKYLRAVVCLTNIKHTTTVTTHPLKPSHPLALSGSWIMSVHMLTVVEVYWYKVKDFSIWNTYFHPFIIKLPASLLDVNACMVIRQYCKPIFIRVRNVHEVCEEILVAYISHANHSLSYSCNNKNGLEKAWLQTLVVTNQFIGSRSWNKVVKNKSCFTVSHLQMHFT